MKVALLMGSDSDLERLRPCVDQLAALDIPCVARVLSAHRTPEAVVEFVTGATDVGVFICAAGGAAHLAGVVAAHTLRPVIGVPMDNPPLGGMDALLATVQMPGGIPVASVAVGGGGPQNAALMAARILALGNADLAGALDRFREEMGEKVAAKDARLRERLA
ncbi:MAG: 5-(carboxyamino)imidazole ribonucleotide mutase [Planctomycetota bacterium]|jgi:5-(carboxyamino)imidazole ribonucleotide mutase|nr:5-(carboxyamino)imidazole ribonucleotide mutase [Planctomycetota bacterium]MDP6764026.1 5-(carboxyamino)imidazole ribonucleotide mutase [Planctomycetota bacterium]MDP6987994.1 5-(carboxyamino)imidazole ribonucleotide mutase [Planctomycetota bacterium]